MQDLAIIQAKIVPKTKAVTVDVVISGMVLDIWLT